MSNYRRAFVPGGTYFFVLNTYKRIPWLSSDIGRAGLRKSIMRVQKLYPFTIDAIVLLPDHLHMILTLPDGDSKYPIRLGLIKDFVTRYYGHKLGIEAEISQSRKKRKESNLWQRRYWEHVIRDENDYAHHCDYIHYNPVKHNLCRSPKDWEFSSFHRFVAQGIYPEDWGANEVPLIPEDIGGELYL
ncbi:transposase [Microcoleus sp. T2B6]|uniref:REP-associated tyrosine transposase n=1 Tax=unclassified Microcoleus TaxID=2642155 RepID=UPI002FD3BB99